jgi:hypothetical protein
VSPGAPGGRAGGPGAGAAPHAANGNGAATAGAIPRLSGDIRPLIPTLGLCEYWYPALPAREVGARKPVRVSLLGDDLCVFRGATGDVVAIQDVCPHRGARLDPDAVPIGRVSVRFLQEQARAKAAASRR